MTDIDDILNCVDGASGSSVILPADWGQGRTAFGGVVGALMSKAMGYAVDTKNDPGRVLRSISIHFIAPVGLNKPFTVDAQLIREGKTLAQTSAAVNQQGKVCATAHACFGYSIESNISVQAKPMDEEIKNKMDLQQGQILPHVPGITPNFLQHVDLRWCLGDLPFSGGQSDQIGGGMRFHNCNNVFGVDHLVALIDSWPPVTLSMASKPVAASSVNWSIDFLQPLQILTESDWLLYRARVIHSQDGIGYTRAHVWTQSGKLLATSRQMVIVYA